MNSKMTTNSQLSTIEPKNKTKTKQIKLSKLEQEQNHRNGDHMEGYQQEGDRGGIREEVQGIRNMNDRYKIDMGRLRIV